MKKETAVKRPNIIWRFGDQHREHALGIYDDGLHGISLSMCP
ncbi:hypothetical protein ACFL1X_05095 [Candidatus Hydrogenedentota bacterium]